MSKVSSKTLFPVLRVALGLGHLLHVTDLKVHCPLSGFVEVSVTFFLDDRDVQLPQNCQLASPETESVDAVQADRRRGLKLFHRLGQIKLTEKEPLIPATTEERTHETSAEPVSKDSECPEQSPHRQDEKPVIPDSLEGETPREKIIALLLANPQGMTVGEISHALRIPYQGVYSNVHSGTGPQHFVRSGNRILLKGEH